MKNKLQMLGGLTVNEFLRDYWQKRPLLIRQAFPKFKGLIDPNKLIGLACSEDVQSRLVTKHRGKFRLEHSPFDIKYINRYLHTSRNTPKWTLLVQGVNHHLPEAAQLLKHFSFIPHARLDDLMVSYAPKGGGVGPHFDSYDVFLLQGLGHRRWQISSQNDRSIIEGAPLKILKNFKAEEEWILETGDMLYLPPRFAHNGTAEDDCMTYSIGFRTPSFQELAEQFLVYLQDRVTLDGMYSDPDLRIQNHPSELSSSMLQKAAKAINGIRWNLKDIANFLGCYLSEPKPHIFFSTPAKPMAQAKFVQTIRKRGLALSLKSIMLCHSGSIYINGEDHRVSSQDYILLRMLADEREVPAQDEWPSLLVQLLYQWYLEGYISIV